MVESHQKGSSRSGFWSGVIASAVGVVLTTLAACSGVSSTADVHKATPVAVRGAAGVAQVEPAGAEVTTPSQNPDPNDALAESKADLQNCFAKYQDILDKADPQHEKPLLTDQIHGRCSHENNLRQVKRIEARRTRAKTRGEGSSMDDVDLAAMAQESQEAIRKHDQAIEYLKHGELPDSGVARDQSAKSPAERRAALIERRDTQARYVRYTSAYARCMVERGLDVVSTHSYDTNYIEHAHEYSKAELARASKANKACRAEAESVAPGGPPKLGN